jgi:YHS domain-containing protein
MRKNVPDSMRVSRRAFLGGLAGALACARPQPRPNVLFLAADDMRDWTGFLGGYRGRVLTPNLDGLAARGVSFTNAHCASPVCCPSRTAILTGLMPSTSGIYNNGQWWRPHLRVSSGATTAGAPLAVHGYDVVAYFTDKRPVRGVAKYQTTHDGATYRFASQANLDAFQKDPAKYEPQYGGFCAYGVSVAKKFDGDPTVWKVVDGKLYLNLEPDIQKMWERDVPGNIRKADSAWPKIAEKSATEIN